MQQRDKSEWSKPTGGQSSDFAKSRTELERDNLSRQRGQQVQRQPSAQRGGSSTGTSPKSGGGRVGTGTVADRKFHSRQISSTYAHMKIHRTRIVLAIIVFAATSIFAGPPEPVVEKNPAPTKAEESPWSFRLALYGWMQSLDGTVGVHGIQSDINIPFSDILDNLNIGAMGVLELRYKRWALTADMVYADLRGSVDTPFNIFFSKADYEQKQFLGNFVLSYLLVDQPRFKLDAYAGARVNYLDGEITLIGNRLPLPPGFPTFIVANRDFGGSKTWVDPIIGAKFQATIAGPVFARVGGDIGGFGVSSEFTWEAYGVLAVNVTRNFSIGAGYRALGTDYSSGGFKYDVTASGPVIGSEIRF